MCGPERKHSGEPRVNSRRNCNWYCKLEISGITHQIHFRPDERLRETERQRTLTLLLRRYMEDLAYSHCQLQHRSHICNVCSLGKFLYTNYAAVCYMSQKGGVEYVNTRMQELFIMYYNAGSNNTKRWVEPPIP